MPKSLILILFITTLFIQNVQAHQRNIRTSQGADGKEYKFHQNFSYRDLGDAWEDEDGLIWGDLAKDDRGEPLQLSWLDARDFCAGIGATLPTTSDIIRLRGYFGVRTEVNILDPNNDIFNQNNSVPPGYREQVLPNLVMTNGNYPDFWTSNVYHTNPEEGHLDEAKTSDNCPRYEHTYFRESHGPHQGYGLVRIFDPEEGSTYYTKVYRHVRGLLSSYVGYRPNSSGVRCVVRLKK
ncbi:MAG: hypothetical protein HOE90_24735 [Bacteriovoracaceae bacterium]|jgi:hypothetical protein|nr:hypothetical protein [Bacteriovoracaceae bacterium]